MGSILVDYKRYLDRVASGYREAKDSKIAIVTLLHNSEPWLDNFTTLIGTLGSAFKEYMVLGYENGSTDNTVDQFDVFMSRWTPNFVIMSEKELESPTWKEDDGKERAAWMARCRNIYLGGLTGLEYDYVLVVDSDLWGWEPQGVISSLATMEFDGIFANGMDIVHNHAIYYDTWSLVKDGVVARGQVISPFPIYSPLVPIQSGFGGLALYPIASIKDFRYSAVQIQDRYGSEHVGLHASMAEGGKDKFYINPAMTALRLDDKLMVQNDEQLISDLFR